MANNRIRIIVSAFILLLSTAKLPAQEYSVATNLLGWANMGTMNMEASYGFARRWTAVAGVRYNPFTFQHPKTKEPMRNRQQSYSLGLGFWPWHIHSGWWLSGKIRYQEYNIGGFRSPETREGDRVGASLSFGYSYMLSEHFNVGAGAGAWAGYDFFTRYTCPRCGRIIDSGKESFILPDDIILSIAYVF